MYLPSLTTVSILLASTLSYVSAKPAITAPVQSVWKAGTKNIITWIDNGETPAMSGKFDIALMQGKQTSLALVSVIQKDVDSASGQYQWEIPATQAPAKDYAIRVGVAGDVYYSAFFEIASSDGKQTGGSDNNNTGTSNTNSTQAESTKNDNKSGASITTVASMSSLVIAGCIALQMI
ncbi:hypothetical protein K7432_001273 [Basidiobolus ranarum]|uniref:Yeast cell wall synthesis Kre9/Knh1-like N-terminal domain-containing protein n=1 Tax=Basidiobolus ranarum TaxID=34480 RepID=A0ABR2X3P2_9FUNG